MKRSIILLILILLLFIGFIGSLYWLMNTPGGVRWLLSAISRWTPVTIEAQKISGRLGSHLNMERLHLFWPRGEMRVKDFKIRWEPLYLLTGKVMIRDITLEGVEILDHRPKAKAAFVMEWPTLPDFFFWIHGSIKNLRIEKLLYRRLEHNPIAMERLSGHLKWSYGQFTLEEIDLKIAYGIVKGMVELGIAKPTLYLRINFFPSRPIHGIDHLHVNSRLLSVRGSEWIAGNLFIEAMAGPIKRFFFETEIRLARDRLHLQNIHLSRPGQNGTLTGNGWILLTTGGLKMNLKTQFSDLDLSQEVGIKGLISGTLDVEGSPSDYRGTLRIENKKGKWYSGYLSGTFKGGLEGVLLTVHNGFLLNGNVRGNLNLEWTEGFSIRGDLEGKNLDPAGISPDWEGRVNLRIKGTVHWPKGRPVEGRMGVHLLESHLRGQPLIGDIELHFKKTVLHIIKADFKGKGFDLFARGTLYERIIFNADINDLSGLIPNTRGSLLAKGVISWQGHQLIFDLNGQGKNLFIKDITLKSGDLTVRYDEREKLPIELKAKFHKIVYQSFRLDLLVVEASGNLLEHQLTIRVHHPDGQIRTTLKGSYSNQSWSATISELTGSDPISQWKLQSVAQVEISPHRFKLQHFHLSSPKGETVHLHSDLSLKPFQGILKAKWNQLNLARANLWLQKGDLIGWTTGDLLIYWMDEERMRMSGGAYLEGTIKSLSLKIDRAKAKVAFHWDEKLLQASTEIELQNGGQFRAKIFSSQPARMELPKQVRVDSSWESIDLLLLKPWFPKNIVLDGKLSGHLSGEWVEGLRFDHSGFLKVSQGKVKWQHKQEMITNYFQTVDLDWVWKGQTLKGHLNLNLADFAKLNGSFQIPIEPRRPLNIHSQGPLRFSLQGWVNERGLLPFFFPSLIQESQGKIDVNFDAHGTWKNPRLNGFIKLKEVEVHFLQEKLPFLPPMTRISNTYLKLGIHQGVINLNWGEKGLSSSCDLNFGEGVRFQVNVSSPQPAQMVFPERGTVTANWSGIDLSLLKPYLPHQVMLEGGLTGHLSGQWSNGQFHTTGWINVSKGGIRWQNGRGSIYIPLQKADLRWVWRGDHLIGDASLSFIEHGFWKGKFQLPLASRFPVMVRQKGPILLSFEGSFVEKGLLTAIFPGTVEESQGQLHVNLTGNGTWEEPNLKGTLRLEKAGSYLPPVGIRLEDIRAEAEWMKDQIRLTSIKVRSGPGYLDGNALIRFKNWKVSHYEGHLKGDRFQTIRLPELQVLCNPSLDFQGTPEKIKIRGDIRIPELLVLGPPTQDVVRPSPDVIIVDAPEVSKRKFPLDLDVQVRLILGEKVFFKSEGLDVRLVGQLTLKAQDPEKVNADGEIRSAQGHYTAFGQKLELIRGRLIFPGGPVTNPALDGIAARKVGEVQAGVMVSGTLQKPLVKLYSRPAMSDTDILSYIILGQPLGKGTEAVPSLIQAAGAFLSAGESVILQGKLKKIFGLDTLDITIPPGESEVSRSMITIGKYLTPKLYVSLGRSLLTDATLVTFRYTLSKRLEVETTTGTESGATLFYKIEFR